MGKQEGADLANAGSALQRFYKGGTMGNAQPPTKSASSLRDLCERAKVEAEAKALLKDEHTPRQFLELLIGKELFLDAIRLLAYALPKRWAVGWGCLCVRHSLGTEDAGKISETHVAVEKWVYDPGEEKRRAAQAAADKEGSESPSALLATAAFYSGGSIGPPNHEPIAPPDHVTPEFVAGAVMIAAVENEPRKAPEKYRAFLQRGMALLAKMQPGKSSGA
jgi:hypothetical protein